MALDLLFFGAVLRLPLYGVRGEGTGVHYIKMGTLAHNSIPGTPDFTSEVAEGTSQGQEVKEIAHGHPCVLRDLATSPCCLQSLFNPPETLPDHSCHLGDS